MNVSAKTAQLLVKIHNKNYGTILAKKRLSNVNLYLEWYYKKKENLGTLEHNIEHREENKLLLFTGILYNIYKDDAIIKKIINVPFDETSIINFLNEISGSFCGFVWDFNSEKGLFFTDRFGVEKIFFYETDSVIIISNDLFLLKKESNQNGDLCNVYFSSVLFCGHGFTEQTLFKNIKQVLPGYAVTIDNVLKRIDYRKYPSRLNLSLKNSVNYLAEAHNSFIKRILPQIENDYALLLSKGKDCRVSLKHLVDNNSEPRILSFYRDEEIGKPFISFLLKNTEEAATAELIANLNKFSFEKLKISNKFLLNNLIEIVKLNYGAPLHWEFLAAGKYLNGKVKYVLSGFLGDPYAGKNDHHYSIKNKIRNNVDYGAFKFCSAGDAEYYNLMKNVLKDSIDFLSYSELKSLWIKQYETVNSDDLDVISAEGLVRTRGLGRVVPTFHQMRSYVVPIYPYLDNQIMDAYLSIPTKYLKWEIAHLGLISNDKKFNSFPTTRFPISAKNEMRFLLLLGYFRKIETFWGNARNKKKVNLLDNPFFPIIRDDLKEFLNEKDIKQITELAVLKRRKLFMDSLANLLNTLRLTEMVKNL